MAPRCAAISLSRFLLPFSHAWGPRRLESPDLQHGALNYFQLSGRWCGLGFWGASGAESLMRTQLLGTLESSRVQGSSKSVHVVSRAPKATIFRLDSSLGSGLRSWAAPDSSYSLADPGPHPEGGWHTCCWHSYPEHCSLPLLTLGWAPVWTGVLSLDWAPVWTARPSPELSLSQGRPGQQVHPWLSSQ